MVRILRRLTEPEAALRQFAYIDEVALRSLIAARYGAEQVAIRTTESRSRGYETGNSVKLSAPSVAQLGTSSKYQSSLASGRETEYQTTLQSMFKDFLDRETLQGNIAWDSLDDSRVGVPSALRRGDLVQIEVKLTVDPVYKVSAFLSEFTEIAAKLPDGPMDNVAELTTLSEFLDRFMAGQIPLKCPVPHVTSDGTELLSGEGDPVFLCGSTDLDKFWTDPRRVLFGNQRFRVLARVITDSPHQHWSPIKLFEMVDDFLPDVKEKLDELRHMVSHGIPAANIAPADAIPALMHYASSLDLDVDDPLVREQVEAIGSDIANHLPSATVLNDAFDRVDSISVSERSANGSEGVAALRREARSAGGLNVQGEAQIASTPSQPVGVASIEQFIEVELIAIYW